MHQVDDSKEQETGRDDSGGKPSENQEDPALVPKQGRFYLHDDRGGSGNSAHIRRY